MRSTYLSGEIAIAVLTILNIASSSFGAGTTAMAWQEEFDKPAGPANGKIFYEDRGSGKTGEAVIIKGLSNGVLKFGLKSDPARTQDRLNLMFGEGLWGPVNTGNWGPFDLRQYPIIEIKWRGTGFDGMYYALATADGRTRVGYVFPGADRKEKDAQGREWTVSYVRLSPDSSVPVPTTAVKLLGINFAVMSPSKKDVINEVDYIRVRKLNESEQAQERKIVETFTHFPTGRWGGLDDFFPFGIYIGYLGGDFENWSAGYEDVYGHFARHHFNYVPGTDEIELGRFGLGEAALEGYLAAMNGLIDAARSTGMKIGADVRRLMQGHAVAEGYRPLLPITARLAKAFPVDTVVSWYCADEPTAGDLVSVGMSVRALRESDPWKRPELVVFNNSATAESYGRILNLNFWDSYPILEGNRDPWTIRGLAHEYRRVLPDRPAWAVLQAFETRPPTPKGSYTRPTDAEMRLMAYQALAEGVKGLIWYISWDGGGRDEGMESRTGAHRGGLFDTLEDLARRLVPIGRLVLKSEPVDGPGLVVQPGSHSPKTKGIVLSALKDPARPVYYVFTVNENLQEPLAAMVNLPAERVKPGVGVYDLYALDGRNLLRGSGFAVDRLAGGDGRVYLVADADTFAKVKSQILCQTALEDVRAMTPDLTLARRWKLSVKPVEERIVECRRAAERGDAPMAMQRARQAKGLLAHLMRNDSEFNGITRGLSDLSLELTELSVIAEVPSQTPRWWTGRDHPMLVPNPGFLDQSKHYWQVGRQYRNLRERYLKGKKENLWADLDKTRGECLAVREALLTTLGRKLQPAK